MYSYSVDRFEKKTQHSYRTVSFFVGQIEIFDDVFKRTLLVYLYYFWFLIRRLNKQNVNALIRFVYLFFFFFFYLTRHV